jgi:superfamily II DNA or RNA helicase
MTFATRGFELVEWQRAAVEAWLEGVGGRRGHGTIEVFTGGGKTLIALCCAARIAERAPDIKVVVVVPTKALTQQWIEAVTTFTTIPADQIGVLGSGRRDSLSDKTALVAVLNTAAKALPEITRSVQPILLIVDEAHRAGAPKFSRVLDSPAAYRLGLSATPDREEIGEDGEPLAFDEQLVGQKLGPVVYSFGLRDARLAGWLPDYTLSHHAVSLLPSERARYDALSRQIDDAQEGMQGLGGDPQRARLLSRRDDELGSVARRWVTLTGQRKDLLYRASERQRVAAKLVIQSFEGAPEGRQPRVILFHERMHEAEDLREELAQRLPSIAVALEHSGLPDRARRDALAGFASGTAPVLVSVKSLIEGIDVPAADTGISVASTSSVRQRIQSLGRVLRRSRDGSSKSASMHLIYVDDTVDDLIYGKADWSDLTGESANTYWRWNLGDEIPEPLPGPPRTPLPTEEQAWEVVRDQELPTIWPGEVTGQEYSVDSKGVVHNAFKRLIANPQDVAEMIGKLRNGRGGRFRVTPSHRLVIVWNLREGRPIPWVVGQLSEPFIVAEEVPSSADEVARLDATSLTPGAEYRGPTDKNHGSFRISQRGNGTIERAVSGGREWASDIGDFEQAANARRTIESWKALGMPTGKFFVNSLDHAWYEAEGGRFFLAHVPGGYAWPDESGGDP